MYPRSAYEVLELNLVTVTNASQNLAALGLTLNPQTTRIDFQNVGVNNIRLVVGGTAVAGAGYVLLPVGATSLRVSAQTGATVQFITDAGTSEMNVQQMGDEL